MKAIKLASDRDFINKLKEDTTGRNHLYTKFADLIEKTGKEGISFRTDIELLNYALERANLQPDRINSCSLRSAVVDYSDKDNPPAKLAPPAASAASLIKCLRSISVPLSNMIYPAIILFSWFQA